MSTPPPPAKKHKTDAESNQTTEKKPPPPYGSRSYWDERYKKHRDALEGEESGSGETGASPACEIVADSDALPCHAWYFSYEDLRPLILPLILGGRDEATKAITGSLQGDNVEKVDAAEQDLASHDPDVQAGAKKSTGDAKVDEESTENVSSEDEKGELNDIDSDEEAEEVTEREGLAKDGPISVLEVGCGDVPLGKDLARELGELETRTGAKAENVVKRIVCCDYSETVIGMLKSPLLNEKLSTKSEQAATAGDGGGESLSTPADHLLDYVVADARKLPYSDEEFHLVLEKGTLDAMLSDKEIGVSNCVLIVTECARILAIGGEDNTRVPTGNV